MRPISDEELAEVRMLVAKGRAMPALLVAALLARLDEAEGRGGALPLAILAEPLSGDEIEVALTPLPSAS